MLAGTSRGGEDESCETRLEIHAGCHFEGCKPPHRFQKGVLPAVQINQWLRGGMQDGDAFGHLRR